jgi:hypothetical protein
MGALIFFGNLAASIAPSRRFAPFTAVLAGRLSVQQLTGSGPQRDMARADDERAVRARPR